MGGSFQQSLWTSPAAGHVTSLTDLKTTTHRTPRIPPVKPELGSPVLQAHQLRKVYRTGEVDVVALADVSLDVAAGEFIVLLGGGSKKRQQRDIDEAVALWEDFKRRKARMKKGA